MFKNRIRNKRCYPLRQIKLALLFERGPCRPLDKGNASVHKFKDVCFSFP